MLYTNATRPISKSLIASVRHLVVCRSGLAAAHVAPRAPTPPLRRRGRPCSRGYGLRLNHTLLGSMQMALERTGICGPTRGFSSFPPCWSHLGHEHKVGTSKPLGTSIFSSQALLNIFCNARLLPLLNSWKSDGNRLRIRYSGGASGTSPQSPRQSWQSQYNGNYTIHTERTTASYDLLTIGLRTVGFVRPLFYRLLNFALWVWWIVMDSSNSTSKD